jgi:RimJ/RimL family protein N-acetyltransferase
VSSRVVFDEPDRVAAFVADIIGCEFHAYTALGLEKRGELVAGVVYDKYSGTDVSMHVAAVPGSRWMTRGFLASAFQYPFWQLGCKRVSATVESTNEAALKLNRHLGFQYEAVLRDAVPGGDVILMVLWKERCAFLNLQGARQWVTGQEQGRDDHRHPMAA